MFTLEQPSIALNDTRVNNTVQMSITKTIKPDEGVSQILSYVVSYAKGTPDGKLKNLVLNCHADPGELHMGAGVDRSLTDRFTVLAPDGKPILEKIYLRACNVARVDSAGGYNDGNLFCCEIAKNAKCKVIASTATQWTSFLKSKGQSIPYGMLDTFEGTTLVYGPEGNVLSSQTNALFSRWNPVE